MIDWKSPLVKILRALNGHYEWELKAREQDLSQAISELAETEKALGGCREKVKLFSKLTDDLERMNGRLREGIIPHEFHVLAVEERNRYPQRIITYNGRRIQLKDSVESPKIRVQDFIHVPPSLLPGKLRTLFVEASFP